MSVFQPLELEWQGQVYTVPAHRVMGAICRIEEVITLSELQQYAARSGAPIAKLSMAYGSVLRYAGAKVTDDEVYEQAFSLDPEAAVMAAVMNIMQLMLPPSARARIEQDAVKDIQQIDDIPQIEASSLGNGRAGKASSRKPSKRPSPRVGG